MKPYYEDSFCKIFNCDCREILSNLEPVDLVLTDPPYGINYQSSWKTDKTKWKQKIYGDTQFPLWIFDLFKPRNSMYIFCRWDNLFELPPPKSFIVWDKCVHSMGDLNGEWGRQWEGCAFYPKEGHKFKYRPRDIIRSPRVSPESLLHPNEKPVTLLYSLINPNEGDIILDPFMGSGSTLRAAKDLGRKSIGIEIEERYCEISAKRLIQEVFKFNE